MTEEEGDRLEDGLLETEPLAELLEEGDREAETDFEAVRDELGSFEALGLCSFLLGETRGEAEGSGTGSAEEVGVLVEETLGICGADEGDGLLVLDSEGILDSDGDFEGVRDADAALLCEEEGEGERVSEGGTKVGEAV